MLRCSSESGIRRELRAPRSSSRDKTSEVIPQARALEALCSNERVLHEPHQRSPARLPRERYRGDRHQPRVLQDGGRVIHAKPRKLELAPQLADRVRPAEVIRRPSDAVYEAQHRVEHILPVVERDDESAARRANARKLTKTTHEL